MAFRILREATTSLENKLSPSPKTTKILLKETNCKPPKIQILILNRLFCIENFEKKISQFSYEIRVSGVSSPEYEEGIPCQEGQVGRECQYTVLSLEDNLGKEISTKTGERIVFSLKREKFEEKILEFLSVGEGCIGSVSIDLHVDSDPQLTEKKKALQDYMNFDLGSEKVLKINLQEEFKNFQEEKNQNFLICKTTF